MGIAAEEFFDKIIKEGFEVADGDVGVHIQAFDLVEVGAVGGVDSGTGVSGKVN